MTLRWEVRCTHCQAGAVVEAMVPFARDEQTLVHVEHPEAPISGFWEDYICPDHLIVQRRAVWVAERGAINPERAWDNYRNGVGHTTPVPRCEICGQRMSGGQWIGELPLHLVPHIELSRWILARWGELAVLLRVNQHAIRAGELDHDAALDILRGEAESFNTFYAALRRQFRLNESEPPFAWYAGGRWAPYPDEWSAALEVLKSRVEKEQAFLDGLAARHEADRGKPRPPCPICRAGTLYRYEYFAG